ncbi:MAG: TlpA family protein disulfide reductase [Chitinispirillaceae bacterium]
MKKKVILFIGAAVLVSAVSILSGNSGNTRDTIHEKDGYVLKVFINPNGEPCIKQISELESIKDKVQIRYVSTTESADRKMFYSYGVRALPSMIIVDEEGKEVKRFTPGIHAGEAVMNILESLNSRTGEK